MSFCRRILEQPDRIRRATKLIMGQPLSVGIEGAGLMGVRSEAVLFAWVTSPPPATETELVTHAGAFEPTVTVRVIGG